MSGSERLDLIYGRQFHLDDHGEPVVSVGLATGQEKFEIQSPSGVELLISGDMGTRIAGAKRWQVHRAKTKRAQVRYAVVLRQYATLDSKVRESANREFAAHGFGTREYESGALFGFRGWMLDNRQTSLITGDFAVKLDAQAAAEELAQKVGAHGLVIPWRAEYGRGEVIAKDLDGGNQVIAHDVLWFRASHGDTLHLTADGLQRKPGAISRKYRGQLYVAVDDQGQLCAVNRVRESDLLNGVVPAEIHASAPAAALAAQAIAARGQMIAKIGTRHLEHPFVVCAHEHCQVYAGLEREDSRSNQAVAQTAGRVLVRPDGPYLVDTVFSANSGGWTENNEEVWPGAADPQLRGRPDPLLAANYGQLSESMLLEYLRARPRAYSRDGEPGESGQAYRWQTTLDLSELANSQPWGRVIGEPVALEILHRGVSGRINHLRVVGKRRNFELRGELVIRRALGGLRSSMFVVASPLKNGKIDLLGGGYGHGVGMCQAGAMGMAQAGRSHREILEHYYRGGRLQQLW